MKDMVGLRRKKMLIIRHKKERKGHEIRKMIVGSRTFIAGIHISILSSRSESGPTAPDMAFVWNQD